MVNFLSEWILTLLIVIPIAGAIRIALMRPRGDRQLEDPRPARFAFGWSLVTLLLAVLAVVMFLQAADPQGRSLADQGEYALVKNIPWIGDPEVPGAAGRIDLRYHVGVDGLSIWLLLLAAFIPVVSIWASFTSIRTGVRGFYLLMLLLQAGTIGVFAARDLLLFYIFFEFTLIPVFLLIGIWGGSERRRAAGKFFMYTFAGSVLTFGGVLFLAYQASAQVGMFTFDLETLYGLQLDYGTQWWVFLAFAAGFAVKVPLFPFHTWLPLAHTEAPTAGSVLLAAIMLKLGTYGFLRFSLPMLPDASMTFAPLMATLSIFGIIYTALVAWVQPDIKKLVAYSSVSHLGFCILGMFSFKTAGLTGSLLYMVNHGLITGALFLIVGMIYERYHVREFDRIGGLARSMPWLAFFLVLFTFASVGLPGLNGFVGEFLVLVGTFTSASAVDSPAGPLGPFYGVFAATGIVLSAVYMLYMCNRVLFGPVKAPPDTPDTTYGLAPDLTRREIGILAPIAALCVILGVWPNSMIHSIQPAADRQILARVFSQDERRTADAALRIADCELRIEEHRWCENRFSDPTPRECRPSDGTAVRAEQHELASLLEDHQSAIRNPQFAIETRWCENSFSHQRSRESLPASDGTVVKAEQHELASLLGDRQSAIRSPQFAMETGGQP